VAAGVDVTGAPGGRLVLYPRTFVVSRASEPV
jgi:hypothetical protein